MSSRGAKQKTTAAEAEHPFDSPQSPFLKGLIFFYFSFCMSVQISPSLLLPGDDLQGLFETKQDSSVPSRTAKIRHRAIQSECSAGKAPLCSLATCPALFSTEMDHMDVLSFPNCFFCQRCDPPHPSNDPPPPPSPSQPQTSFEWMRGHSLARLGGGTRFRLQGKFIFAICAERLEWNTNNKSMLCRLASARCRMGSAQDELLISVKLN